MVALHKAQPLHRRGSAAVTMLAQTSVCLLHARRASGMYQSAALTLVGAANTLTAKYNDLDSVRKLLEEHKGEVAGVILEPVVGNSGFIAPTKEFLQGLREITEAEGTLLIFDEVMTGFRCALRHSAVTRSTADSAQLPDVAAWSAICSLLSMIDAMLAFMQDSKGLRPGALRHHARSHHPRQDHWWWAAGGCLWWQARHHADSGACWPHVPGASSSIHVKRCCNDCC